MLFFCIDIVAKYFFFTHQTFIVGGDIVNLSYFANTGIAFSLPLPREITLVLTGGILLLALRYIVHHQPSREHLGITALFLGSLSNFGDRILTASTTDYLIFFQTSAINIADILILFGIAIFAWYHRSTDIPNAQ